MILTEPTMAYAAPLRAFRQDFLDAGSPSEGSGSLLRYERTEDWLAQVARYADPATGLPTMESPDNPNGSVCSIEGIISPDGKILGKMGHSERYEKNLFRNISGNLDQDLFANAVAYFRKNS